MAFQSLDNILNVLQHRPEWQEWREFEQLSQFWVSVVGAAVSQHARPISIHDRVLQVATSNAVWAQQLTFERVQILRKLNPQLTEPLKDIRFSSARWSSLPQSASNSKPVSTTPERSPFRIENDRDKTIEVAKSQTRPLTSQEAFERWAQKIQARSRGLPLCPQCQCPTPGLELQRWSMCAPCRAKQLPEPPPGAIAVSQPEVRVKSLKKAKGKHQTRKTHPEDGGFAPEEVSEAES